MRLTFALLFISTLTFSQTQEQKDSVMTEVCNMLNAIQTSSDSIRIMTSFKTKLEPFVLKYPADARMAIFEAVHLRLLRTCPIYLKIMEKHAPKNGDWEVHTERPVVKSSAKECKTFTDHEDYFYLEGQRPDTVKLTIKKGLYTEQFKDGSYSKLKFKWVNDCEFEIEFIESNNRLRKNISRPGDGYRYQILETHPTYYRVLFINSGSDKYNTGKIYISQKKS